MNAFDVTGLNQNALAGGVPVNLALITPSVTFVSTWGTHIVFTDAGTYTSPDSFGKIQVEVSDEHGATQRGVITSATGTCTIATDSSHFNLNDKLIVKVTIISTLGVIVDGAADVYAYTTSGALGSFTTSFTETAYATPALEA